MSTIDPQSFGALLGSLTLSEFFERYWLTGPVVLQPMALPAVLRVSEADILTWYATEGRANPRFTSFSSLRPARAQGSVRVQEVLAEDEQVTTRLWELAGSEALIVRDLAEAPRFREYCSAITRFWRSRCSLNCYLIRAGADHFPLHQDGHHIFAIQSKGRKRWYLYPPSITLPMSYYKRRKETADPSEATIVDVDEGQILYIPTGWRHHAETVVDISVHFSLGLHPLRWVDLLKDLSELAGARHHPLRDYVPFTIGETGVEYGGLDMEDGIARLRLLERDFSENIKVLLDHHNRDNPNERRGR